MKALLRLSGLKEYLKGSLWALPAAFVLVALLLGTVLSRPPAGEELHESILFGGTPEAARELLSALAGAMITVTGLTFSLTVVALQMAAAQYSPRVLRGFLADRGNQLVLSSLVGTFAYTLAVLRNIREGTDGAEEVLPELAVTLAVAFSLGALGMLVYFLHHLTRQLRVDTILDQTATETLHMIDRAFPERARGSPGRRVLPEPSEHAVAVPARRSGYLQAVERTGLRRRAAHGQVIVRLRPQVGTHITEGTTIAWVWRSDGEDFPAEQRDELDELVHHRVQVGAERTMQQDVAFGMRQMVDIAVKALSTGVNDPTTAVDALGHLSVVICRLADRELGSAIESDEGMQVRVILPRPDFRAYLDLLIDQILRYGGNDPAVAVAVLHALDDVAEVIVDQARRDLVSIQVDRVLEVAARELDARELVEVAELAEHVGRTLADGCRPQPDAAVG